MSISLCIDTGIYLLFTKVHNDLPLLKFLEAFCLGKELNTTNKSFIYNHKIISDNDTAKSLNLLNNCVIQIVDRKTFVLNYLRDNHLL